MSSHSLSNFMCHRESPFFYCHLFCVAFHYLWCLSFFPLIGPCHSLYILVQLYNQKLQGSVALRLLSGISGATVAQRQHHSVTDSCHEPGIWTGNIWSLKALTAETLKGLAHKGKTVKVYPVYIHREYKRVSSFSFFVLSVYALGHTTHCCQVLALFALPAFITGAREGIHSVSCKGIIQDTTAN